MSSVDVVKFFSWPQPYHHNCLRQGHISCLRGHATLTLSLPPGMVQRSSMECT